MRSALLCLLVALFAALSAAQIVVPQDHYKICSGPSATAVVHELVVEPFPPKIGGSVRIAFNATLTEEVAAGSKASVSLRWGVITIVDDTFDICALYPNCPIAPQSVSFDQTIPIPGIVPQGRYRALIEAVDHNGKEIVCIDVDVTLNRNL